MAKTFTCPLCGKEIKCGFFSTERAYLTVTDNYDQITCCEECGEKYKAEAKEEKYRFSAKVENARAKTHVKMKDAELGKAFAAYLAEKEQQKAKAEGLTELYSIGCFRVDDKGNFATIERSRALGHRDLNTEDTLLTIEAGSISDSYMFNKNDITKLEYRRCSAPASAGFLTDVYSASFDVFLNDESVITYKPCVARVGVVVEANMFTAGSKLEKKLLAILDEFKDAIGTELPIKKASRI